MAIALDTSATSTATSFSYTCTGTNRILIVSIGWSSGTAASSTSAPTYGGVALTQIQTKLTNGSSQGEMWYLKAPATGANTLAFTLSGSGGLRISVASYTGVDQTSPINTSTTLTPATFNSTTAAALTVTTTVANCWIIGGADMAGSSATTDFSVSSGTVRQDNAAGTGVAALADIVTTTAGSNTLTWTNSQSISKVGCFIVAALAPSSLSIALDTTVTSITTGFGGTITKTWTHTITGANPLLVLVVDAWQDVAGTGTVTAATYNGVAMTLVTSVNSTAMRSELWYLKAPATGANTVSVTFTGNRDSLKFATSSFINVDQTSPLDASNTAIGTTGNPAVSLTTATANALVVGTLSRFSVTAATTSNTSLYNDVTSSTIGASDYRIATTTGSYTDTYTGTSNNDWSMVTASFKPAIGGGAVLTNLFFF